MNTITKVEDYVEDGARYLIFVVPLSEENRFRREFRGLIEYARLVTRESCGLWAHVEYEFVV